MRMSTSTIELIRPDWPAPAHVQAWSTTRAGGVSEAPWDSLNLGAHVGDAPDAVNRNRRRLGDRLQLPEEPLWLQQVHGDRVRLAAESDACADACLADRAGQVCVVMTADCLPVLLCNRGGSKVAAAHAGWRGLHSGILERTVAAFGERPGDLIAWLGPAIGPQAFEVGDEVRDVFINLDSGYASAFGHRGDRWLADLVHLAKLKLAKIGVPKISGGQFCTYTEADGFFSFRREGQTGRMITAIYINAL